MVLGATQCLHALAVRGARGVNVGSDGCGPHKAHGFDIRVIEDAINSHLVTVHDIEDAVGKTGLLHQFGDE